MHRVGDIDDLQSAAGCDRDEPDLGQRRNIRRRTGQSELRLENRLVEPAHIDDRQSIPRRSHIGSAPRDGHVLCGATHRKAGHDPRREAAIVQRVETLSDLSIIGNPIAISIPERTTRSNRLLANIRNTVAVSVQSSWKFKEQI